jgi:hypothetical protein
MLGELLGEAAGKITGTRVLPSEGQQIKLEVSLQGSGTLLGEAITNIGTYWHTITPEGVVYGEGHVLMMTQDDASADWTGFGVGRPTGPAPAAHYGVYGSFLSASGKLAYLASVANASEYEVEQDGSYHWKLWAWK